jgi:hypothetical protein
MKHNLFFSILTLLIAGLFIVTSTMITAGQFSAGFAQSYISPKKADGMFTNLAGVKPTGTIDTPLLVKALVLSDGKQRIAMVVVDAVVLYQENFDIVLDI